MREKTRGFSVVEVLIASGLFAFVVLGIAQAVMVMHRYSRSNICKMQAHLTAMSYFEQILGDIHPLQLQMLRSSDPLSSTGATLKLFPLDVPNAAEANKISLTYNSTAGFTSAFYANNAPVAASVYGLDDMPMQFKLEVRSNPLYENYTGPRSNINPPVGFQSIHLTYRWQSSTVSNPDDTSTWPSNQLYAIRPITPDDPT